MRIALIPLICWFLVPGLHGGPAGFRHAINEGPSSDILAGAIGFMEGYGLMTGTPRSTGCRKHCCTEM